MFVVNGATRQGLAYRLAVGPEVKGANGSIGKVLGPPPVLALLMVNEGQSFRVTVTGPTVKLDLEDPASILGALYALTQVTSVEGDAPQLIVELADNEIG